MTYRDIFYYAEQHGYADTPVVLFNDAEQEFYEVKKATVVPEKDVLKNLILEETGKDRLVIVV
jgi:hypothetical protein